ncbi:MAG: valine--tRNA ligase [bacterium]
MDKSYDPKQHEQKIYKEWEKSGFFNPDNLPGKRTKKFSIAMPPPNATGILHLGHATMLAIQDIILRQKRMQGYSALWVPGTDHASIATQTKVEKIIAKEGLNRHSLGREKFLEKVEKFVAESQSTIRSQIRQMGSSCDWSRERYTLDSGLSKSVQEIFIRMYNDGLIYRGNRIVNWCPRCESTLSDDEVEFKEEQGKLYFVKYPVEDQFITIATTRPETMLGDTAIAVNPGDKRYQSFIGKMARLPLSDRQIPIIADAHVDMEFATGALKITPGHDKDDFEVGKRHGLEVINIFNNNGTINGNGGKYEGLTLLETREKIAADLEKLGLIDKIEDYLHSVGHCYRCEAVVEPLVSLQWFINVNKEIPGRKKSLKELSVEAVRSEKIKIVPKRFEKIYFNWMENLEDWCISRQIWFGHRIPAYYCECGQIVVSLTPPVHCWKCGNDEFKQDPDTLDTWFSSGLWTFSTLGWPEKTSDLKKFHPTSLMETGYDILFFWIGRMILMSQYALQEIPFETVYLHGLVRDKLGRKMSKSLGNGIDPIDMINKFGADALRLSMIIGATAGNDFRLYEEKIAGYRNFVNKFWNIARFILKDAADSSEKLSAKSAPFNLTPAQEKNLTLSDKWILYEFNELIQSVNENMDSYQLSQAGEALFSFSRDKLADWYLEISKIEKGKTEILLYILSNLTKLLHPFTPFITEEIWKKIPEQYRGEQILMVSQWPKKSKINIKKKDIEIFETLQKIVASIRNVRAEYKIEPAKKISALISASEKSIICQGEIIKTLARLEKLEFSKTAVRPKHSASIIIDANIQIFIPLENIIDIKKEAEKLSNELSHLENFEKSLQKELANKNFLNNAPEKIKNQKSEQLETTKEKIKKIKKELEILR